jgi:hypothetical protein
MAGGFRAIVAHRSARIFFSICSKGTQAQQFFWDNPLFPSAHGTTPQEALQKLDVKLGLLYQFENGNGVSNWKAQSRFVLKAQYDSEPGEERCWYDVSWSDIIQDLRSTSIYFYDDSKNKSDDTIRRNLNALIKFK